jgi:PAS domain S-box-containing protein
MTEPGTIPALTLLIPGIACAALAWYAWGRRTAPETAPFACIMLSVSWWSLWYAAELLVTDVRRQLIFTKLEYVGITSLPVGWFLFSLYHAGFARLVTWKRVARLLVVPATVMVAAWTNDWHHLMWVSVWPVTRGTMHTYASIHGPLYWLNVGYSHLLVVAGTILIVVACLRAPRAYRVQSMGLLLAAFAPWVANIAYLMGYTPVPGFDLTPYGFIVSGVLILWSLQRLRLLGLLPVARESVLASMRDGVLILDEDGRVVEANPSAMCLLGRIRPGAHVGDLFPAQLPPPEASLTTQVVEMPMHADDTDRYLEVTVSALAAEAGRTRGSVILLRDVTPRRQAELALRDALQRFESVVQNAPLVAIQGFDREGHILHWNRASEALYGYAATEVLGKVADELIPVEDHRTEFRSCLDDVWHAGVPTEPLVWEVITRTGARRVVYSSMFPVHEAEQIVEVIRMDVDVTERRQVERAERLAAIGQLAAGVAHEFNNLLAAMMLRAEMTDVTVSPRVADLVDVVLKSTRRGAETCRNLMAFARPRRPQRGPVVLQDTVEAALRVAAHHLENAQVQVTRTYLSTGLKAEGDAGQLEQVFLNLILNACHAMSGAGIPIERRKLSLSTSEECRGEATWLVVKVADTGSGIAPENLQRIFEPFFTTKRDSGEGAGTGLGLPVSQGIIEAHGGRMEVHSQLGEGTCFEVWLPAAAREQAAPDAPGNDSEAIQPPDLMGAHILVAEDDDEVRPLVVQLLSDCGARVDFAIATEGALDALARNAYDLVVTDVMMPGGGGGEVLAAVARSERRMPVVVITGRIEAAVETQLHAQGAAAVLEKPFSITEVYETVAGLLRS